MPSKRFKKGEFRDGRNFAALPWDVIDSAAYRSLSHPARSLLIDLLRQFRGSNNGQLLLTTKVLAPLGWRSVDVVLRARDDLVRVGLLHLTVQGRKPSWASWYALTFLHLDQSEGYDPAAARTFRRGAYRDFVATAATMQNAVRPTPDGAESGKRAPRDGVGEASTAPPDGAHSTSFQPPPTPSDGAHLAKPSPLARRLSA